MDEGLIESFSLAGRVCVVTGAASGIGRATAQVFAEAGARVVLCDVDRDGLRATAALIASTSDRSGQEPILRETDVSQRDAVEELADAVIAEAGRLDSWVNAAGVIFYKPIDACDEAALDWLLGVNLKGVFWCCAAAGRVMGRGGTIVNLSSAGAEMPSAGLSVYGMAKAAVSQLTRTAAVEFGPAGIRVNAIAPGWIDTPMTTVKFRDDSGAIDTARRGEVMKLHAAASPVGLTGEPRDIALAALPRVGRQSLRHRAGPAMQRRHPYDLTDVARRPTSPVASPHRS